MARVRPPKRKASYGDFTIGWICAIRQELIASRAMLDEEYALQVQKEKDPNSYVVGRIGQHKVVMACLDCTDDPSSATNTAVQLVRSFPRVTCGLMVGIGGAVPRDDPDIRLGDVVVAHPRGTSGGVVAFEVGKAAGGATEIRGHFNHAPDALRGAANTLDTDKGLRDYKNRINKIMEKASDKLANPAWPPPEESLDVLLCAQAPHSSEEEQKQCVWNCDPVTHIARRQPRVDRTPQIHRGIIASSHKVIADQNQRDRIVEDIYSKLGCKILCFEMEAFSLVNKFPCLVVRGISDYADSTKNDIWQPYASLTAAAYAKELLLTLLPANAMQEDTVIEQASGMSDSEFTDCCEKKPVRASSTRTSERPVANRHPPPSLNRYLPAHAETDSELTASPMASTIGAGIFPHEPDESTGLSEKPEVSVKAHNSTPSPDNTDKSQWALVPVGGSNVDDGSEARNRMPTSQTGTTPTSSTLKDSSSTLIQVPAPVKQADRGPTSADQPRRAPRQYRYRPPVDHYNPRTRDKPSNGYQFATTPGEYAQYFPPSSAGSPRSTVAEASTERSQTTFTPLGLYADDVYPAPTQQLNRVRFARGRSVSLDSDSTISLPRYNGRYSRSPSPTAERPRRGCMLLVWVMFSGCMLCIWALFTNCVLKRDKNKRDPEKGSASVSRGQTRAREFAKGVQWLSNEAR